MISAWNELLEREILPNVEKPSRYTGAEWNASLRRLS